MFLGSGFLQRHAGKSHPRRSERDRVLGQGQAPSRSSDAACERATLMSVEERNVLCRPNLPNVVRIISREWLAWIARAGRSGVSRHNGQKVPSVPKAEPLPQGRVHFREGHGQARVYEKGWTAEGHAMTGGEGQWTTQSQHRRRPVPHA